MSVLGKIRRSVFGKIREEKGQTAIEYVLVIVLAVLVIVLALQDAAIQDIVLPVFGKISNLIEADP